MKHAWRTASGALLLLGAAACSEGGTGDAPSKAASGAFDKDPFPSTYEPYPSNPVLLQILSQGSDPMAVQKYYEKIFDAVDKVVHDKRDKSKIQQLKSIVGVDEEIVEYEFQRRLDAASALQGLERRHGGWTQGL